MNPVSLRVILEGLVTIFSQETISEEDIAKQLQVSEKRTRELTQELTRIQLVNPGVLITCTEDGERVIMALKHEDWKTINAIFERNCCEYRSTVYVLSTNPSGLGLTLSEIIARSKKKVSLNIVTAETCVEWGRRLKRIDKNLYTSGHRARFYALFSENPDSAHFKKEVLRQYDILNKSWKSYTLTFVSIPELRENVCEALRMERRFFDSKLIEWYSADPNRIEFAGGPLTSSARRAPTKKLSIFIKQRDLLTSPKIDLETQEGLAIAGKIFQTVAFHS